MTRSRPPAADVPAGAVVALRALGLGDFLTGVPAYRALRRAFPDSRLVLAAPAALTPLVPLTGVAAGLVDVRGLTPVRWPGSPPRVAVNLHGNGPQSHRLLRELRPGRLVAFACPDAGVGRGPVWRYDEHEVHRWCRLLGESSIPADPTELDLARPAAAAPAPGAVVIHPGAASESRRWPAGRFAGVARAFRGEGHRVVVTGSAGERSVGLAVADAAGIPAGDVLAGRTGLAELAAQVAAATLVISGDTGVAHLATAYRRPSVVLFGPTPPRLWGPPDRLYHAALWRGDRCGDPAVRFGAAARASGPPSGDPHGTVPDPALLRLSVADVVEAARGVLAAGDRDGESVTCDRKGGRR